MLALVSFGLSYKAAKVQLARGLVKMLGDYLGRGRQLKDPEKAEAIRVFPDPESLKQLQEFLCIFGYIRRLCRASAARYMHTLRPWLKGEEFPLTQAAKQACQSLRDIGCEQVIISSIDEELSLIHI